MAILEVTGEIREFRGGIYLVGKAITIERSTSGDSYRRGSRGKTKADVGVLS